MPQGAKSMSKGIWMGTLYIVLLFSVIHFVTFIIFMNYYLLSILVVWYVIIVGFYWVCYCCQQDKFNETSSRSFSNEVDGCKDGKKNRTGLLPYNKETDSQKSDF